MQHAIMKMQKSCLFFIISLSLIAVILQAPESHASVLTDTDGEVQKIHGAMKKMKAKSVLRAKREALKSNREEYEEEREEKT